MDVTDKRKKIKLPEASAIDRLMQKTFRFVFEQPEYWEVLQLPRSERKRLERGIAKILTRFPNHMKNNSNA